MKPPASKILDYDLHGVVGVRLENASEEDAAAVARQLGPLRKRLDRTPDIVIHFQREIPTDGLTLLGLGHSGFTPEGFFILRSGKEETRVRIDFSQIGGPCQIFCRSGLKAVPLLMAIINLTAFSKGLVPLHASAFRFRDKGVLVTGWAKGGKTEALLAFSRHGAEYVGDEWILLQPDGERMFGIPEEIRLWDWHLPYLPHLNGAVGREDRLLFRGVRWLDRLQGRMSRRGLGRTFPMRMWRRAMPALRRQLNVTVSPAEIFPGGMGDFSAPLDRVFLMVSQEEPCTTVEAIDSDEVSERMIASVRYEILPFWEYYLAYRFSFPQASNEFLDTFETALGAALRVALQGKPSFVVRHPYPCSFDEMYQRMESFC